MSPLTYGLCIRLKTDVDSAYWCEYEKGRDEAPGVFNLRMPRPGGVRRGWRAKEKHSLFVVNAICSLTLNTSHDSRALMDRRSRRYCHGFVKVSSEKKRLPSMVDPRTGVCFQLSLVIARSLSKPPGYLNATVPSMISFQYGPSQPQTPIPSLC